MSSVEMLYDSAMLYQFPTDIDTDIGML